jgi:glutamine amidotransferase
MIAIVQYNAGNIFSVRNALNRLNAENRVTDDPEVIRQADKVIFPGVGEASSAMTYLKERGLDRLIKGLSQPVLGICLGMQLMCSFSEEGNTPCLNIFGTHVKKFPPEDLVPHMGWNALDDLKGPLFKGLSDKRDVYFVHSYYAELSKSTTASVSYIHTFSAAMEKDNFFAVQFHPEKSADVGETILKNFLRL